VSCTGDTQTCLFEGCQSFLPLTWYWPRRAKISFSSRSAGKSVQRTSDHLIGYVLRGNGMRRVDCALQDLKGPIADNQRIDQATIDRDVLMSSLTCSIWMSFA